MMKMMVVKMDKGMGRANEEIESLDTVEVDVVIADLLG
jgi:hypothetical protein